MRTFHHDTPHLFRFPIFSMLLQTVADFGATKEIGARRVGPKPLPTDFAVPVAILGIWKSLVHAKYEHFIFGF